MRVRRYVRVAMTLAVAVASLVLAEGNAFAKAVTGTGSVTCDVGGTGTFNPPLSENGTPGKKEIITVNVTLSNCSGGTPTAVGGGTLSVHPFTIHSSSRPALAGSCVSLFNDLSGFGGIPTRTSSKVIWSSGVKTTKDIFLSLGGFAPPGTGELGFALRGGANKGSYPGIATIALALNLASTAAFTGCEAGSDTVSSATFDPSLSVFQITA